MKNYHQYTTIGKRHYYLTESIYSQLLESPGDKRILVYYHSVIMVRK